MCIRDSLLLLYFLAFTWSFVFYMDCSYVKKEKRVYPSFIITRKECDDKKKIAFFWEIYNRNCFALYPQFASTNIPNYLNNFFLLFFIHRPSWKLLTLCFLYKNIQMRTQKIFLRKDQKFGTWVSHLCSASLPELEFVQHFVTDKKT